jgi:hypothetical protein
MPSLNLINACARILMTTEHQRPTHKNGMFTDSEDDSELLANKGKTGHVS